MCVMPTRRHVLLRLRLCLFTSSRKKLTLRLPIYVTHTLLTCRDLMHLCRRRYRLATTLVPLTTKTLKVLRLTKGTERCLSLLSRRKCNLDMPSLLLQECVSLDSSMTLLSRIYQPYKDLKAPWMLLRRTTKALRLWDMDKTA